MGKSNMRRTILAGAGLAPVLRASVMGAAVLGAGAIPLMAQNAAAPVARYEMKAETLSGLGGMGTGMGAAMSMAFGGGGSQVQHSLLLELGSTRAAADGKPKADHFMPAGAKLGKSVALKTPVNTPQSGTAEFQRPKGRMLIYWGCGEHAPKGQPVVIDFSKLAAGQVPAGLFSSNVPVESWVSPANSRTYGSWPSDDKKSVKSDSSLVGAHRVAGNYSPEMNFTLSRDFMPALRASNVVQASGATLLSWTGIADATGYYAWIIGGKGGNGGGDATDIVWWTSSASREFGGGLSDWLSPATVARLVANRTVMSPQTSTCIVPAEVKRDAPDYMFGTLNAYGPQEDFAFPPRPANPKAAWNPEWTARIRHKSTTSFLIGMPGMEEAGQQQPQCQPKKKKKGLGGLGGALGGALGGVIGGGGSDDGC